MHKRNEAFLWYGFKHPTDKEIPYDCEFDDKLSDLLEYNSSKKGRKRGCQLEKYIERKPIKRYVNLNEHRGGVLSPLFELQG